MALSICRQSYKCAIPGFRFISMTKLVASGNNDFAAAKEKLSSLTVDPGNAVKLKLYALFKQATAGTCNTKKPGVMDFVGKAKWSAWKDLGELPSEDAKSKYVELVNDLAATEPETGEKIVRDTSGSSEFDGVLESVDGRMYKIILNRPKKKNALNIEMYEGIISALKAAGEDKSTAIAVLTGNGDFYCSGNDLSNFMNIDPSGMNQMAINGGKLLERFVNAFIDFPKPLVAVVNGPAVGVSVTTLGLCDIVLANEQATFHTPFSNLGQTPEGCSSLVFPRLMGPQRANDMLLFNKKLTAVEANKVGLVTEVFPDSDFKTQIQLRLKEMSQCPPKTLKLTKQLIRGFDIETLHEVNKRECDQLVERWQSDECINAIMNFFQKKSKL